MADASEETSGADVTVLASTERGTADKRSTQSARTRDVVFIHSDAYFRALSRLPVHPQREQMTLALLLALADQYAQQRGEEGRVGGAGWRARPFGIQFIAPSLATDDQLMRFHARDYVDTLRRTATEQDANQPSTRSLGGECRKGSSSRHGRPVTAAECEEFELVDDAYVFPGLYEYCQFVAGASLTAADALRHLISKWKQDRESRDEDPTTFSPAPVAINLGGGRHHAMRSQASGFCYVNDVVLCVQRLLSPSPSGGGRLERVLCVDIDVHHGDGVQEAFFFSSNVTTISFHLLERAFFPGTGTADEVGMGRGKHHTINVPLRRGIVDSQFEKLFETTMGKAVECADPEVIVLVCGVDTLARDSLGGFNLTSRGISNCVKAAVAFNRPFLLLGGGGYSGADACRALAAVVTAVAQPDFDLHDARVPDHDFYEAYGPDFRMETKPVIHRPNENTDESLDKLTKRVISIIETARGSRLARHSRLEDGKRKRP